MVTFYLKSYIKYIIRLLVNKSTNHWLRVEYSKKYESPITFIKVVECEYESPEFLVTLYFNLNYLNLLNIANK